MVNQLKSVKRKTWRDKKMREEEELKVICRGDYKYYKYYHGSIILPFAGEIIRIINIIMVA